MRDCASVDRRVLRGAGLLPLAVALLLSSCAQIGYTEPTISDAPIKRWRQEVPTDGAIAEVESDGTTLSVSATQACNLREDTLVRRTETTEAFNKSSSFDWLLAGLGIASAGAGTVLLVDSGSTYANDDTSRTYNPEGPDKERLYAAGLLAAGVALVAIPIIDAIRASDTRVQEKEVTVEGDPIRRGVACSNRPFSDRLLVGKVGNETFSLGTTDPQGRLQVALSSAIDRDIHIQPGAQLSVIYQGATLGTVSLDALQTDREGQAWARVEAERCRRAAELGACNSVQGFLRRHPTGPHARQARTLLNEAEPKLAAVQAEEEWQALDKTACTDGHQEWPNQVESACQPFKEYLNRFPTGSHAADARQVIRKGSERAEEMRRDQEREARTEERKAARRAKRQCRGTCQLICSQIQFRLNYQECFSGCMARECE